MKAISFLLCVLSGAVLVHAAEPSPLIHDVQFRPFNAGQEERKLAATPQLLGDRFEYWDDDRTGQFYVVLDKPQGQLGEHDLKIDLLREGENTPLASATLESASSHKASFLIRTADLPAGKYLVGAALLDSAGQAVGNAPMFAFERTNKKNPAVRIPDDGLPLHVQEQLILPDMQWPVRASVPLPIGAVDAVDRLALFEDGKPIPAQFASRATWGPKGSIRWLHADFAARWRGGKPLDYRLKLLPQPPDAPQTPLRCEQSDDLITVDTGFVRFEVARKEFTGIRAAWFDPTGTSKYDDTQPVINGSSGPYIVDGRMIRFDSKFDKNTKVEVEEQGPVRVTIVATGWYSNPEGRVDPLCIYKTRFTAHAGSPVVQVSHHTIITYDTRLYRLRDVGFELGMVGGERVAMGVDGKEVGGELPKDAGSTVFIHQDRHDHVRVVGLEVDKSKTPIEGQRSDGWMSVSGANASVSVLLRDVWQKFPKELEAGRDGVTLHFWPKHGHRAFTFEQELELGNIYKFWCFHQHALLDLNLPTDYFDRLSTYPGMFENVPEHALNGNGQGLAIGNDFAIVFSMPEADAEAAKLARLFEQDPIAMPSPQWNGQSGALGMLAGRDEKFAATEDAFEQGLLSWTRSVERGQNYGMWIYADNHTYWHVDKGHADLHRVWLNSHYHQAGTSWLMFYRSGNPEMLRWARATSDNYRNVDTINYADPPTDGRFAIKFHTPGAMYHCKGFTQWGSETYGMRRRDSHARLWGHFADPDAHLWAWLIDANPRARDLYELWHSSLQYDPLPLKGTRRESNTSMAITMSAYQATYDPDLLPHIHGMGRSLREDEPLEKQHPGPMWHPLWINRYYEQTRDPLYVPFVLKYGRLVGLENTWNLALSALAYDLSGDTTYLTAHFPRLHTLPRELYHNPNDSYDWYGNGPGPLGFNWAEMGWGYYVLRARQAGIEQIQPEKPEAGAYPIRPARYNRPELPASLVIYALEEKDRGYALDFNARAFGGDLHIVHVQVVSPSGKVTFERTVKAGAHSYRFGETIPADGEAGLNRVELRTHEAAVRQPITDLSHEATELEIGKMYRMTRTYAHVQPAGGDAPLTLTLVPDNVRQPVNYIVSDARGKVIAEGSMFKTRPNDTATVTLDPASNPYPWIIDVMGATQLTFSGEGGAMLFASTPESLRAIAEQLKQQPPAAEKK